MHSPVIHHWMFLCVHSFSCPSAHKKACLTLRMHRICIWVILKHNSFCYWISIDAKLFKTFFQIRNVKAGATIYCCWQKIHKILTLALWRFIRRCVKTHYRLVTLFGEVHFSSQSSSMGSGNGLVSDLSSGAQTRHVGVPRCAQTRHVGVPRCSN